MSAATDQQDGNGSAVWRVLAASAGVMGLIWLSTWQQERPAPSSSLRTGVGGSTPREDGDYSHAAAAVLGAIHTLVLQALCRRLRKRDPDGDYERTLVRDLAGLLQSGLYADITFVLGDTEVKAHRAILAARGVNMGAMPRSNQRVVIKDVEPGILKRLLEFLYTGKAPSDPQVAMKLLAVADKYNVDDMKEHCGRVISQNLCVENAADCAALAVRHSCDCLMESSIRFIMAHFNEVMDTYGWRCVRNMDPDIAMTITQKIASASLNR